MISSFFTYLLTAALLLLGGTALYYVSFWRSTFLRWNRVLLWCILAASLSLPLVHLPADWTIWHQSTNALPEKVVEVKSEGGETLGIFYAEGNRGNDPITQLSEPSPIVTTSLYQYTLLLFYLYCAGCLFFSLRFLLQLLSLLKLYRKARIEQKDGYRLAICPGALSPFAFGRSIFVSEILFQNPDLELILTHEQAHVQQRHTLDILGAELNLIWQWFNPGAWLYRRAVESNLEYLADRNVLEHWDKKQYQLSLLNWMSTHAGNRLSTSYSFSLLKERIMMMNRKSSPKVYLFRYALTGLLLPCLLLFNQPAANQTEQIHTQASSLKTTEKPTALDAVAKTVVAIPLLNKPITTPVANPTLRSTAKDTTPLSEDVISFILLLNPDLSPQLQEKLKKEKWPFGKNLDLLKNDAGRIIGITMTNITGGSSSASHSANNDLPIVIFGSENGVGVRAFNNTLLDQLISGKLPQNPKVIAYGVPLDPNGLEGYRAKITSQNAVDEKNQLEKLAANHWVNTDGQGSTGYRIPVKPEIWSSIEERIKAYKEANKSYEVILNGLIFQSTLPQIDLTKIKKMTLYEKFKTEYVEGTLKVKNTERVGLRLEIETE